jgi:hypothetical protein
VLNTATRILASYRCAGWGYAIAARQNGLVRINTRLTPEHEVSTAILILRFVFSLDGRGDAQGYGCDNSRVPRVRLAKLSLL